MDDLIDIQELYGKARKYLEEHKHDPETEPYKSQYKAMDYLKQLKEKLLQALDKAADDDAKVKFKGMLAVVLLLMGTISIDTEELTSGEKYLNETLENVIDEGDPRFILTALSARNQLGILWSTLSENEKAKKYLEDCIELYERFINGDKANEAVSFHQHFDYTCGEIAEPTGQKELEKVHILTKFYLAQVYGKLGDTMKSAVYCYDTLRHQLETKTYDPIDWALNTATLSQFFMERKQYRQARHLLAAASYMLDKYEEELKWRPLSEDEAEAKKEELRRRGADVSRCWAKFGIFLLEQSKLTDQEEETEQPEELQRCWFTSLELSEYESQMTDHLFCDFDSARDVMLVTQKHLNSAKEYCSLEHHASDYIEIVQDHSTLFRHLAHFEKDEGRICKMHKKRINMLEEVVKEVNPQYYMKYCQAIWFELGEIYQELMSIKQNRIRENAGPPNPSELVKSNQLAMQSIQNFKKFLDSVKGKRDKLPDPIPEDLLRPTLVAHFSLGLLYHRIVAPDKRQTIENTYEAYCNFKYVVDYCNNHDRAKVVAMNELSVSEDMVTLLDMKIRREVNLIS